MTVIHFSGLNSNERQQLISEIATLIIPKSPFFIPVMKSGAKFHYEMTNCGDYGWISDRQGYRYTKTHPITHQTWPALPPLLITIVEKFKVQGYISNTFRPETCLINKYLKGQSLGLHQDNTEEILEAPIISLSLGSSGIFLLGGFKRSEPTQKILLHSGDIFILSGEDRMRFHGFKGIIQGHKRINLTIRQVFRSN